MIKLKIESKENNEYVLKDENNKTYKLNIEFADIEQKPENSDYISISAKLLDDRYREYTRYLIFGGMKNICGRDIKDLSDTDLAKLEISGKEIYLKRLYG